MPVVPYDTALAPAQASVQGIRANSLEAMVSVVFSTIWRDQSLLTNPPIARLQANEQVDT